MFKTPKECYSYIVENGLETSVLSAMMRQVGNFSIAEIADGKFKEFDGNVRFISKGYNINMTLEDDDIITAVLNGLYVSAFISRKDDKYQVHFLVSGYPKSMKCHFEEEIAKDVVRYMIMSTIVACQLNSVKKVEEYIKDFLVVE